MPILGSIVVNNYNYGRFLAEAIDSALGQTYRNLEVIVVDDGSTDDSQKIIARYSSRITSIIKDNGGQASAFNAGFARSHGDFVIFLDSDDRLSLSAAEKVAAIWRPGVARVQFPLNFIDDKGQSLDRSIRFAPMTTLEARSILTDLFVLSAPPTSGNAFSRDILSQLLPMPEADWRISADTFLLVLSLFLGEVICLRETLGEYRLHDTNSVSASNFTLKFTRERIKHDCTTFETLRAFLSTRKAKVADHWLFGSPRHVASRLISLRLDKDTHPFPQDRRLSLLANGLRACWKHPLHSASTRFAYAAWISALALAPSVWVSAIAEIKLAMQRSGRTAGKRRQLKSSARKQAA